MNPADSPLQLFVEDISRLPGAISSHGGGFSFWLKDEDQYSRWGLGPMEPEAGVDGED